MRVLQPENGFQFAEAEFRETGKNKIMRALYQMMDFQLISNSENHDNLLIFKRELTNLPSGLNTRTGFPLPPAT